MIFLRRRWLLALAAILSIAACFLFFRGEPSAPAEAFRTGSVDRGDIRVAISATGSLGALSTVDVGTQVSGQVQSVEVDFNDTVKRGQVIARIDPANVQARVTQASAALASAQAQLAQAQASLRQAEADHARKRELVQRQLVSRTEFDLASAALEQARAQVATANAAIRQQQAALDNTRVDLGYTDIVAPVDGVVLARSVEPGQTVAASFQTPVLFRIAEDLRQMQIVLAVDEADIGQVAPGQKATFTVDAFPDRRFEGEVRQVRLAATSTANVITYPVVVAVDNRDLALLPGMTVNAEIEVSRRDGVLRVPNAALRFKPPEGSEGSPATGPRNGGLAGELPRIAGELKLDGRQQAAFDEALAAMRERMAARVAAPATNGGGNAIFGRGPGGQPTGNRGAGGGNAGAMRQRLLERFNQQFASFRGSLRPEQQAAWDAALLAAVSARRAPVYRPVDGRPTAVMVRVGASDGAHTEVEGELREGDTVIVGTGRTSP